MKLGIIGAGMIVKELFNFIHEIKDIEITAISATARSAEKLQALGREYKINNCYLSTEELVNDTNVEVVYVAVPNHLHYPFARQALEAGKHVICEKPFTSNIDEARHLAQIAGERNLILIEAVTTNYLPNMLSIKENLYRLGDIKIVSTNYSQYSSRYDAFKAGQIAPAFDPEMSGGALMDINIYNINFVVTLFGRPLGIDYQANTERGIDTSGILTLDYGHFKCVCIGAKDCRAPVLNTVQGDKGCICIDSSVGRISNYKLAMNDNSEELYDLHQGKHIMYHEFCEFVRIIREADMEKAGQMLETTLITMEIQTEARKKAGLISI